MDKPIPKEIAQRLKYTTQQDGTLKVKSIEPLHDTCEDCGVHTPNGRSIDIRFCKETAAQVTHTKIKCVTCGFYRDPKTGKFNKDHSYIMSLFRKSNLRKR